MMNISMREMDKAISIYVYIVDYLITFEKRYTVLYIYVYIWVGVLANLFNED